METHYPLICPVCESPDLMDLVLLRNVPVHCNVLWKTAQQALDTPKGDIHLYACLQCSHVFNSTFDPDRMEYSPEYENSLHFSPTFQSYAGWLVKHIVADFDIHGKKIIEIGSGKGDFLVSLCQTGENQGTGFDPSLPHGIQGSEQVNFIQDFYSEKYLDLAADLLVCRQVLEHIHNPNGFLNMIQHACSASPACLVCFEVPNALFTLRDGSIWDLIYEHPSFFTPYSLATLFERNGFKILEISEVFGGQFLLLFATYDGQPAQARNGNRIDQTTVRYIQNFQTQFQHKMQYWQQKLDELRSQCRRVAVWGTGSKGVTFLNLLETADFIPYAVDINPRKQGSYVPGTGQTVISPDQLKNYCPDVILIMNPLYSKEIQGMVKDLGLDSQFLSIT